MRKAILEGNPYIVQREIPFFERDTTCYTEQAGYVDAESQIKRLLYAGENLLNWKREFYDFPDGEYDDDVSPDPTETYGFDPVDAQILMEAARKRLKRSEAAKASMASDPVKGSGEDTSSPDTSDVEEK